MFRAMSMIGRKISFDDFIQATREGKVDTINRYIHENKKNPAALNIADQNGDTALICAAYYGRTDAARLLIEAGAALNIADQNGGTALIYAAFYAFTDVAHLLIEAGADLNIADQKGNTALIYAAHSGFTNTARLLIEAGADLNATNQAGTTALICAAYDGHTDAVRLLIEARADLNATNQDGNTALICAVDNGYTDAVRLLIEAGANLNATNQDGNTALICAVYYEHTRAVRLLIEAGAALNIADQNGDTALIYAANKGRTKAARLLIEAGADLNTDNQVGNTALICAANVNKPAIVAMLLEAGADVTLQNKKGKTAEVLAANNLIRSMIQNDAIEKKLEAFEKKRAVLVKTQIKTVGELEIKVRLEAMAARMMNEQIEVPLTDEEIRVKVQLEKEQNDMQRAATLAFHSAIGDLNFLLAHRDRVVDVGLLPELIMRFSELMMSMSDDDDKKMQEYSHALLRVAAKKGHPIAQHIESMFRPNAELEREIQEEMKIDKMKIEKASAPSTSSTPNDSSARVTLFGLRHQLEKKQLEDPVDIDHPSISQ